MNPPNLSRDTKQRRQEKSKHVDFDTCSLAILRKPDDYSPGVEIER